MDKDWVGIGVMIAGLGISIREKVKKSLGNFIILIGLLITFSGIIKIPKNNVPINRHLDSEMRQRLNVLLLNKNNGHINIGYPPNDPEADLYAREIKSFIDLKSSKNSILDGTHAWNPEYLPNDGRVIFYNEPGYSEIRISRLVPSSSPIR